jgi:hypothetical protein
MGNTGELSDVIDAEFVSFEKFVDALSSGFLNLSLEFVVKVISKANASLDFGGFDFVFVFHDGILYYAVRNGLS